jgi:hypothetical protein
MSAAMFRHFPGTAHRRREVRDVPEMRRDRDELAGVIGVRKQRLNRLERERVQELAAWRDSRTALRAAKQRWRMAVRDAREFWQQTRAGFLRMEMTSGQFRKAKATYERMKSQATKLHLECREVLATCKQARSRYFDARRCVIEAHRQQEKLVLMRDEIQHSRLQEEW